MNLLNCPLLVKKGIIISLFRLADNNVRHDLFQQNQANYVYKVNVINKHTQKLINNLGNYDDANQAILAMNQFNANNISDNFLAQIETY